MAIKCSISSYFNLFLDEFGEAVPTMQAISCNDLRVSAKILLKTLKHLEPKASSNISVLMSDDFCYNAFVESVAEVLQLEVLTTIPLQKSFVDKYVRTVQCALAPYHERLDEIVYAFYKMMLHINRKIERVETGFRGEFQSFIQKDFELSHPETNTFTADIQPDGSWNILNIQSTDAGGQVLETQNVTKCAAIICNPTFCKVVCPKCPKGSPCSHAYVCSCPDYLQRNCCAHIHIVSILNLDRIQNPTPTLTPLASSNVNIMIKEEENAGQLIIPQKVRDVSVGCSAVANEFDFKTCKSSASRYLTAALCYIQSLKDSAFSQSMCVNLIAAINKFPEIPVNDYRVTKYCTNVDDLPNFERATILVKNEKGIKNRVPIWQDKINTSHDVREQVVPPSSIEDNKENIKTPQLNLKPLPGNMLKGVKGVEEYNNKFNKKDKLAGTKPSRKILGRNSVRYNLLKEALHKDIHSHCWVILLSEMETNELALANFGENEREILMQKMVNARSMWSCGKCDSYQISLILGGYAECHVCNRWFHILCCNNLTNEHGEDLRVEFDEDLYICDNCSTLVIIDSQ